MYVEISSEQIYNEDKLNVLFKRLKEEIASNLMIKESVIEVYVIG